MISHTRIEIKPVQKIRAQVVDDCGTQYTTRYLYRVAGDAELYGEDAWREGTIRWSTTEEWKAEEERIRIELEEDPDARVDYGILVDESRACDWDSYEILDENGDLLPEAAAKEVAALLP